MCQNPDTGRFSVWQFTETDSGRDYYFGAYHDAMSDAKKDFKRWANDYRCLYRVQEKSEDSPELYCRYYSTQRPVDIGTYPKPEGNCPLVIVNYDTDRRRPVSGGKLQAWGELVYVHPLTKKQADDYELAPSPIQ